MDLTPFVARKFAYRLGVIADQACAPGALFDDAERWGRAHR
jgi:hypothetical protein